MKGIFSGGKDNLATCIAVGVINYMCEDVKAAEKCHRATIDLH